MKTREKLHRSIMNYWFECIKKNMKTDMLINNLMEKFFMENKVSYHSDDLDMAVENLTNSQMRELYKRFIESGIIDL